MAGISVGERELDTAERGESRLLASWAFKIRCILEENIPEILSAQERQL